MDFSGLLLCSDFDNTFYRGDVPAENIEAVKRFMDEGGHFTFCTGRKGVVMEEICRNCGFMPNVPIIGFGGGELYDPVSKKTLTRHFHEKDFVTVIRNFMKYFPGVARIRVDCECLTFYFTPDNKVLMKDERTKETTYDHKVPGIFDLTPEELPPAFKAVVYLDYLNEEPVPPLAKDICGSVCNPVSNDFGFIEIMPLGFDKGTAALELKKFTGDRILAAVGDFNGDIPLLKASDIGFAVENALPEVKAVADHITVNVKDGSLRDVIRILETSAR